MLVSGWRGYFEDRILARGKKYWEDGRVTELCRQGDTVTAKVMGTESYDVQIWLVGGAFDVADCTCPYAFDGNACKHMAAVLFALEAGEARETKPDKEKQAGITWREALEQMSERELRSLLAELADGDRRLQERLVLRKGKELPAGQYKRWAKHLEKMAHAAGGWEGFIEYDQAYDFCMSVYSFLEDTASDLMEAGLFLDTFRLACMVYDFILGEEMDDSDGGMTEVMECCVQIWTHAVARASADEKKQMHGLLAERLPDDYGTVEGALMDADWDPEQQQASLKILDGLIEEGGTDWEMERHVEQRRQLMEKLGADKAEIQAYIDRFRRLPAVRQTEIKDSIAGGDDEKAIALLRESKRLDGDNSRLVMQYSEQLAELYRRAGQTELYEQELRFLVFSCPSRNIGYVKQLKELTPAAAM